MHMNVHDRLACFWSDVDADVVATGAVTLVQPNLGTMEERHDSRDFVQSQVEEGLHVSPGHDERVPGRDGESVFDCERQFVRVDDPPSWDGAEWAIILQRVARSIQRSWFRRSIGSWTGHLVLVGATVMART